MHVVSIEEFRDNDVGYLGWFDNQRRLRALISELETLSQQIADNDPRWER